MKRFIFSALALAAVAVGCTKSEMIVKPNSVGSPISISPYLGRTVETKAESVDLAYLQGTATNTDQTVSGYGFHVYALLHADNVTPTTWPTKPYMDKDVYWVEGSNTYGIPAETTNLKVVFGTSNTQVPEITTTDFVLPAGSTWTDQPTKESTYYVVYELSDGKWTAGDPVVISNFTHANGTWEYDGVTYWPEANGKKSLAFVAYGAKSYKTNTDKSLTWTENPAISVSGQTLTFTVKDKVAEQQDLIIAPFQTGYKINDNASNTNVCLNFQHMLSRVGFKLVANQNSNVEIRIDRLELKGAFNTEGKVNLMNSTPSLGSLTGEKDTYTLLGTGVGHFSTLSSLNPVQIYVNNATWQGEEGKEVLTAAANTNANNCYMMLIPTVSGSYTIEVDYTLTDATQQKAVVTLPANWQFEQGKSYEFVLKVSTSSIGFYVEVSDWLTGTTAATYPLTAQAS